MAEYIYFVASLPSLYVDRDSAITYKAFMECAKEQLSKTDYSLLCKATFDHEKEKVQNHIIKDWDSFNYTLNEYLTEERAIKLGLNDPKYKAKCSANENVKKIAHRIVNLSNPLEAEKEILNEYFAFLLSHPVQSQFSLDALIVYGLLLQIKERVNAFSKEKGKAEFDRLYNDIRKDISLRSSYEL